MSVRLVLYGTVQEGMMDARWRGPHGGGGRGGAGNECLEMFVGEDGQFVNGDVYADEAAMFTHVGAATESGMLNECMAAIDLKEIRVLDPVCGEAKKARAGMGGRPYSMVMGF